MLNRRDLCLLCVLFACLALASAPAFATDTQIGNVFCTVAGWFTGNTGKGLATISIIVIGMWKYVQKISGPQALIAITGIAIIFGAAQIIDTMGAGAASGCAIV